MVSEVSIDDSFHGGSKDALGVCVLLWQLFPTSAARYVAVLV
jgi:hypothetical protein